MKLVRFGAHGAEKPGIVDRDGNIRDLCAHVPDFSGANLAPAALAKLAAIDPSSLPKAPEGVQALGRRYAQLHRHRLELYADHAKETGQEIPSEPILFGQGHDIDLRPEPRRDDSSQFTPHGLGREIAFVIGARARYVEAKDWANYIAGYSDSTMCPSAASRASAAVNG